METKSKYECSAPDCGREYSVTPGGRVRKHASRGDAKTTCTGSGKFPKNAPEFEAKAHAAMAEEWDRVLAQGDGEDDENVVIARGVYETSIASWDGDIVMPDPPDGMTLAEFENHAARWLSKNLAARREEKGAPLTLVELMNFRRARFDGVLRDLRMEAAEAVAPGSDNPMYAKMPADQAGASIASTGDRGPYFPAGYPGDCSECAADFGPGDEIRADGEGGWQGRICCGDVEDEGAAEPTPAQFFSAARPIPAQRELPPPPWHEAEAEPAQLPPPPWLALPGAAKPAQPSPADFFTQEKPSSVSVPKVEQTALGKEITARFKELFFSYVNRDSSDNRGAQKHLGPSEIGSPCDRRIALSLMQVPPCNPGGDSWASWVGTQIHRGLAEMFDWANHGTGRFVTELGLEFPVVLMPKGTTDLLDRTLMLILDHKAQGAMSAKDLATFGPAEYYRVQAHTYGYGARLKGEEVEHVAITSWPRDRSTLANLYTWTEPYDESVALTAIARIEGIAERIQQLQVERANHAGLDITQHLLQIGREFETVDQCKFCPFHAAGDKRGERGCQGANR